MGGKRRAVAPTGEHTAPSRSPPGPAYRPLGTFRLFLALLVVLQHYLQWVFPGRLQALVMPWAPGSTAVLVFFVVSGFVIVEAVDRFYSGRPGAFLTNRLARIFPLYIVAIVVSWAVLSVLARGVLVVDQHGRPAPADALSFSNLVRNVLVILPLPGRFSIDPGFKLLQIAWALRVELAFYIVVALLVLATCGTGARARERARRLFAIFAGAVAIVALAAFFYYEVRRPPWNEMIEFVPEFCAGGAFYFALRRGWLAGATLTVALFGCVLAILRDDPYTEAQGAGVKVALLFLILLTVGATLVLRGRLPPSLLRLDKQAGEYSYPIYVGHWLPILVFTTWRAAAPTADAEPSKWVAVALAFALPLSYFLIVEPGTRRLRDHVRGRKLEVRA